MKHGILTKWNANSDSTSKVMLIKHGQLGHIALTKQMINNILKEKKKKRSLILYQTAQNFNGSAQVESSTSANELASQGFMQWLHN